MNVNDVFESKYLKAADLKGKKVPLTINGVEMVDMGQGDDADRKPLISFVGHDKGLVLNKTNTFAIAAVYGDETDDWIGKEIKIYPTTTQFQGKMTPCIRVDVPMPEASEADDIPF